MSENYTYEHDKIRVNELEKYFNSIETYLGHALEDIEENLIIGETKKCEINLIKKMIERLMGDFIIFYYRSGALLYEFSYEQTEKQDRILIMLNKILDSRYIYELSSTIINCYSIAIVKSENKNFLLSDQFLSTAALGIKSRFLNVSNRYIGLKNIIILIPISKEYYIVYFDGKIPNYIKKNNINILNDSQVRMINNTIINNSYKKCVAYNNEALESAIANFEYSSPSATYASWDSRATYGTTKKKEIFFYNEDKKIWDFFIYNRWHKYIQTEDEDMCPCGSNKSFSTCCKKYVLGAKQIMNDIANGIDPMIYRISPIYISERAIEEFFYFRNNQ